MQRQQCSTVAHKETVPLPTRTVQLAKTLRDTVALTRSTWTSTRREMLFFSRDRMARSIIMGGIAAAFVAGVFVICLMLFTLFFAADEEIATLILSRLAEYGFAVLFFMMLYSSMLTSIHVLLSDRTLCVLWTWPVSEAAIWWSRIIVVVQKSSWMVAGFAMPVLLALGIAAGAPLFYYLLIVPVLLAFGILPCGIGIAAALTLVFFLPPRRLQQVLLFTGLAVGMLGVLAFQRMRLERILQRGDPTRLAEQLAELRSLPEPIGAPMRWAGEGLLSASLGRFDGRGILGLMLLAALVLVALYPLGRVMFYSAWSRNTVARDPRLASRGRRSRLFVNGPPLLFKDSRVFFRELEQWSSVVMVLPLVLLCVGNMKLVFSQMPEGSAILGWANLLMNGMIVSGVGARILYPAFSLEGAAFWNVLASPLRLRTLLWSKFLFYSLPLIGSAVVFTTVNGVLFSLSGELWALTMYTSVLSAAGICAIGIAFAAAFPQFRYRQVSQVVLSMGGLYYMRACFAFVAATCLIWLVPFLRFLPGGFGPEPQLPILSPLPWLIVGTLLSVGTVVLCLLLARRALSRLEWSA